MAGRTGFLGGWRQNGNPEWDDAARPEESLEGFRFTVEPAQVDAYGRPIGFDPIWGTLGAPSQTVDPWNSASESETVDGTEADVEVFGNGFQISGRIRTGGFDRLSDWLNMQTGFIQLREATHVILGHQETLESERRSGNLWIRMDQIVLVAERATARQSRGSAQVVQKQRHRVSVVTPGYQLRGNIHIIAAGSMKQFLQTPEPHYLPITDVTVHWLDNPQLAAHFPFAVINREQLITVVDEPETSSAQTESHDQRVRQWGAA